MRVLNPTAMERPQEIKTSTFYHQPHLHIKSDRVTAESLRLANPPGYTLGMLNAQVNENKK